MDIPLSLRSDCWFIVSFTFCNVPMVPDVPVAPVIPTDSVI
jgi:hypothetical protein